jgi:exodeoxyribonuclease VII small subunit
MKDPQNPNFEAALKELDLIVQKMEQEDLHLEEALTHFEVGVKLSAHCQKILKAAEQKIEIVQNTLAGGGGEKA